MLGGMTFARPTTVTAVAGLAFVLLASLFAIGASDAVAQTASASGGCDLSVRSASRTVRPGGRVLLTGTACAGGASASGDARVSVKLRKSSRWATVANTAADSSGEFAVCAPVRVPRRTKVARLQVQAPDGSARTLKVRLSSKGKGICVPPTGGSAGEESTAPSSSTPPPPDPPPNGDCPLSQPESNIGMTLPDSCTVVASDTASASSPLGFWGSIDCETDSRHKQVTSGGDTAPTATGTPQGNSSYRSLTAFDGDDFWGERCELGMNDHRSSPVAFYREGQRRVTYASFRLPASYPLDTGMWQGVLQMKQSQPSDNGGGTPVISLGAYDGKWMLFHSEPGPTSEDEVIWEAPAQNGVWNRVAIDAKYSQHHDQGWIKLYIDLNGDGDFSDSNEQSETFHTNTLKYETGSDSSDGYTAGQSLPSHLRVGMYHHQGIACQTGCAVETDNVQVVRP
jgi:hypothetical protein